VPVTVTVRLNGPLAERLGPRHRVVLPDSATADDLVRTLLEQAGEALPRVAVSVDGRVVGGDAQLADNADVSVLVPYAGG
jgi:molybdopterin converting factor small subunit